MLSKLQKSYYPKTYSHISNKVKVRLLSYLSNYAIKKELKYASRWYLDVYKLKIAFVDLKKLSDVVSKEIVKETVYKKPNRKVNNLENKIPDITFKFT